MIASPVTFVVATYNRGRLIEAKLGYLAALSRVAQVVVIDDGSDDDTFALLSSLASNPGILIMRNRSNRGSAYCWNLGAGAATGEILVYLADDALDLRPSPDVFIGELLRSTRHAQLVGIHIDEESRFTTLQNGFLSSLFASFLYAGAGQVIPVNSGARRYAAFVPGIMGVRRDVALRILFDEDCFVGSGYREESDFQLRARRRGFRIIYSPALGVRHSPAAEGGQSQKASEKGYAYWAIRNHVIFVARNGLALWPLRLALFIPYQILLHSASLASIAAGMKEGFTQLRRCRTISSDRP